MAANAMKRLKDGEIMPYSKTLVAARPGDFVEVVWVKKTGKWEETSGVPLVAPPEPPARREPIPDDDDDDRPAAAPVDPEPETLDGEDSPEDAQRPKRRRKGA